MPDMAEDTASNMASAKVHFEQHASHDSESQAVTPLARSYSFMSQFRATVLDSWVALLLPTIPAGFIIKYINSSPVATFVVNFIAIIPLGKLLTTITNDLVIRTGGHVAMAIIVSSR